MATRVGSTKPATKKGVGPGGPKFPGPNGKGPRGNGAKGGEDDAGGRLSPSAYRIAMWAVIAAVLMMFAVLSVAFIALSTDEEWRPVTLPRMFYASTVTILLSSVTVHYARRRLKEGRLTRYQQWLVATLLLGLAFLASQVLAWRELIAQGAYANNPNSSFFYLFTGVHGVHLVGGIIGLVYLLIRLGKPKWWLDSQALEVSSGAVALYWHTMDALWIWLFLLLLVWR